MENRRQIIILVFTCVFAAILLRLFQIQVVEGGKYRKIAAENAAKIVPSPAPRGIITDRSGKVLVENYPVFSVQVLPSLLSSPDQEKKRRVLNKLEGILGEKLSLSFTSGRPIIVKDNLEFETALKIEERKNELEGVTVNVHPERYYPFGSLASHLLGYVGEIGEEELKIMKVAGYHLGDKIGKDGIEKYYDKEIRGIDGGKKIEVDVYGRPVRLLESLEPAAGADVKLTLDLDLQLEAEKALEGKEGAIVAIDPRGGEILALASHPNYDSNNVEAALLKSRHPFINRALAIFPPGSIFKVVTLTAVLEEKAAYPSESFNCPGYYRVNQRLAKCWKEGGHGSLSVLEGLVQSCDVVFYELGRRLGPEKLAKYARLYGLGEKTEIDLPQEKKGLVPDGSWKTKLLKEPWYEGDSINYGIGQGFLTVTPLQMAALYGTVATGKRMKPYVVSEIRKRDGEVTYRAKPEVIGRAPATEEHLKLIRKALNEVVERGTGRGAKIDGLSVSGKTGTAENPGRPHAWFVCYAPSENPVLAMAVFIAHGEHGDRVSSKIARRLIDSYR